MSTSGLQDIYRLEFYWRQISEARVQSLLVVDLLYELGYVPLCFLKAAVVLKVDLLHLQRSEKALGLGILVGVAYRSHTDPYSALLQASNVLSAGILNALIGMVDQPRVGLASGERHLQG